MSPQTPLEEIHGLSAALLEKLRAHRITTAEQLAARATTPEAIRELASLLDVQAQVVGEMAAQAREAVQAGSGEGLPEPGGELPAGSFALDQGVCAACGKDIRSVTDVAGTCAEPGCAHQICRACWEAGRRRCTEHAAGGEPR